MLGSSILLTEGELFSIPPILIERDFISSSLSLVAVIISTLFKPSWDSLKWLNLDIIFNNYSDAIDYSVPKDKREEDGKKIALFNNLGYLQLSIYRSNPQTVGSASTLFGLNYRDVVSVYF